MDKNYYLQYYDYERNHWWFKARNKILINLIKKYYIQKNPRILNIGVATGHSSELLGSIGEVVSVENDTETYNFIKNSLKLNAVQGSILNLPFDNESFDIVCAFDVIEHVKEDKIAVNEMIRVCSKNGLIALSVPAFQSLWSEHDEINHHIKRYRIREVKQLFKGCSSNILYSGYFNFFLFFPIAIIRLINRIFIKRKDGKIKTVMKSDFEKFNNNFINKILYSVFYFENLFIRLKFRFFAGVSIVCILNKK
ncbi:MAG: class I SAM-dependent methyltransferase [Bacteroidota bacterium]